MPKSCFSIGAAVALGWAAAVLVSTACSTAGTPHCECLTDPECGAGRYCSDCRCVTGCLSSQDCLPATPNCNVATGHCEAPCPEYTCPADFPNCGEGGICNPPCEDPGGCTGPDEPNCGPDGLCYGPCSGHADCLSDDLPNCDPATGVCQGECPSVPCPGGLPNCDPASGLCRGPCPDVPCPEGQINCTTEGLCLGPCDSHADCIDRHLPNCDLDPASPTVGICLEPCDGPADCPSPVQPNCDPDEGTCLLPCGADEDCPTSLSKCDTATGLCFRPGCLDDEGCSPPETVCEQWFCVPGCSTHGDCPPGERCDLVTADGMYHCEPRDCLTDADCSPPATVCDTDGLVDPYGGGYCRPGCRTPYDCALDGYGCDPATGRCAAVDYGDVGADCTAGCRSGFCLADEGNVCTRFCCIQNDCPAGWACRPHDDGAGDGHDVGICVPLDPTAVPRRFDEICLHGTDCRSGVCTANRCSETCCVDGDCSGTGLTDLYCGVSSEPGVTACLTLPTTDIDPLGAPGCGTSGTPGDCLSNLCFTFYIGDAGCTVDSECPAGRPTCWDLELGGAALECVRDFCLAHCCGEEDCPDYGSDKFACSKWGFGSGDYDVCMLHEGTGTLQEGEACTGNSDCRSMVCSDAARVCRRRCCTDVDCTGPSAPRCALEENHVFSSAQLLNVCLP